MRTLFGEEMLKLQNKYDLNNKEFANKIGFSENYISAIVNGLRNPTTNVIKSLINTFDLSESESSQIRKMADLSVTSKKIDLFQMRPDQISLVLDIDKNLEQLSISQIIEIKSIIHQNKNLRGVLC